MLRSLFGWMKSMQLFRSIVMSFVAWSIASGPARAQDAGAPPGRANGAQTERRGAKLDELDLLAAARGGPEWREYAALMEEMRPVWGPGRWKQRIEMATRAVEIAERVGGPNHMEVAGALSTLAGAYEQDGQYAEAAKDFERALAIVERAFPEEDRQAAGCLWNLGNTYHQLGRHAEAAALLERAVAAIEEAPPHLTVEHFSYLADLATVYEAQRRFDEAEPLRKRALALWETQEGYEIMVAFRLKELGEHYVLRERYADAELTYERAMRIVDVNGLNRIYIEPFLVGQARMFRAEGKLEKAEALYERALEYRRKGLSIVESLYNYSDHPDMVPQLEEVIELMREMGQVEEAEAQEATAARIRGVARKAE